MRFRYLPFSVFLVFSSMQAVFAQQQNIAQGKQTLEALPAKPQNHTLVRLAIDTEIEFFGEKVGETTKKSTKSSVVLPVSGSAMISRLPSVSSEPSPTSATDERNAIETEVSIDLDSVNHDVVFTLLRVNQTSSLRKHSVAALKMQVAAPLGKSESATLEIQETGSPGSVKSVRVLLSPSSVDSPRP